MQISNREKKIIESLLKNPHSFLTIHQLAQNLGVSSRTVHRELKFVEATLDHIGINLERQQNKGIKISGSHAQFAELSELLDATSAIDLSVEEQKVIILYTLIRADDPVKLYSLASEIGVSINTLNKELTMLTDELDKNHLTLKRKRGEGLILEGDEVNKRQLLADLMLDKLNATSVYSVIEDHFVYQTLNDRQLNEIVDLEQIFNVERLLMDNLSHLPYVLMETAYLTLTIHIVLSIERIKNGEHVTIPQNMIEELSDTREFHVAKKLADTLSKAYDVVFEEEEIIFITMHLRGAKRRADETTDVDYQKEIKQLITIVSDITGYHFHEHPELYNGILLHLVPALNRISGGIETYNPLTEMIKNDYDTLFQAVKAALLQIFPEHNFPDGEIAFIVIHFGGVYPTKLTEILVVCTSGIGTSRILSNQIERTFPYVKVKSLASVSDLKTIDLDQYDYIVSTIGLDISQAYSVVNPLLPEQDINTLSAIFKSEPRTKGTVIVEQTLDYEKIVPFVVSAHELIESIDTYQMTFETWLSHYAATFTDDVVKFCEQLIAREDIQGFAITGHPVAIPHIASSVITKPTIALLSFETTDMKNMDGQMQAVNYSAVMLVPESSPIRTLISELSILVMEHMASPDKLFNDKEFVVQYMQEALMKQLAQLIK